MVKALDDHGARSDQLGLEIIDGPVAALDLLGRGEMVDALDEHVLVMRAVEDAHLTAAWQFRSMRHKKSWASSSAVGLLKE